MNMDQLMEGITSNILEEMRSYAKRYAKYSNFVHLHLHTIYSFLDGFNRPEDSARRAKELGMTAMAITDHNHLAGVIEFQKACKEEGVKPLLGYEGYHTWNCDSISLSIEDRYAMAIEAAKKDGVEVANEKKPTKDDKEVLKPYSMIRQATISYF